MREELTLQDIHDAIFKLELNHVMPRKIKSRNEAEKANRLERLLGLKHRWKIGDEYYLMAVDEGFLKVPPK